MPRADCSSNTVRDSISRVAPSLRGPRFAPALRHARRPCALTRGRPAPPTHKTESPLRQTHYYCTVQHHVPIDPYAERMPRADCSSNTSRNTPPLTTESPTTHTTDQHHVPMDPRAAELMPSHAARLALTRSVTQKAVDPSMGPALRVRLTARAASEDNTSRRWGALAPQRKTRRFTGDREFGVATAPRCCMCPLTNAQRRSQRR